MKLLVLSSSKNNEPSRESSVSNVLASDIIGWRTRISFNLSTVGLELVSGSVTVMENSNLQITIWMMAITFINATKKRFSATELQN